MKIIFSKIAKADLREIYNYIKRDSVKYALLERKKIELVINKLYHQPFLGKKSMELKTHEVYELIFQNYKIVYRLVSAEEINILTIHHHARSISNNPAFTDTD
ncbi:MAG: type II toxin-antitoxin system RelE/ParE family toxin [Mucilaginibacter sp.]